MSRKRESFQQEELSEAYYSLHPGKSAGKLKKKESINFSPSKDITEDDIESLIDLIASTKSVAKDEIKGRKNK